jgi:hypothetical protein
MTHCVLTLRHGTVYRRAVMLLSLQLAAVQNSCQHVVMNPPTWTAEAEAIGTVLTPIAVAALVYVLTRNQSRSTELQRARLEYYKMLVPDLNRLMCYMTFIGNWRDWSPVDIINLKRRLDANFYCAAPLFSPDVYDCYDKLMEHTFATFSEWGEDAHIKSSAYRRRTSWKGEHENVWKKEWDRYFTVADSEPIPGIELQKYRQYYDQVIAAAVKDLAITRTRPQYTTNLVGMDARAPKRDDIIGLVED